MSIPMSSKVLDGTVVSSSEPKKHVIQFPPPSLSVRHGDKVYSALTLLASLSIFGIMICLAFQLTGASMQSIHHFGLAYITKSNWDETADVYGILPYIFGTLYSAFIALLIAVPISIGCAIFLSELSPVWLRTPVTFLIELLAAIPSVVYGLWGIFVMVPFLKVHVMTPITHSRLTHMPVLGALFSGDDVGLSMLAAGVILAIMVIPFITAVTRDILKAIPKSQREGSYALGSTQWETISKVVLPYAKSGIVGAIMLGLGRAMGETMAVTMVIGNQSPPTPNGISWSVFQPGYTMASALANKFNEAGPGLNTSALVEIGLVLFGVTIIVNILARLLVFYTAKDVHGGK
jgi:phosphate transport system permease protein